MNTKESVIIGFIKIDDFSAGEIGVKGGDIGDLDGVAGFIGFSTVRQIG